MFRKILTAASGAVALLALMVAPVVAAQPVSLEPWTFDPGNACDVVSELVSGGSFQLEKNCPTPTNAAAGAEITGVDGMSTTGMTLSFDYDGYCGAGAPRVNVYLDNGTTAFLGCAHGDPGATGTATFEAGNRYGGVLFPEGETVTGIDIVLDEEGQVILSNVSVNGDAVLGDRESLKDACKKGGYQNLTDADGNPFRNQGQCVSYMNHLFN